MTADRPRLLTVAGWALIGDAMVATFVVMLPPLLFGQADPGERIVSSAVFLVAILTEVWIGFSILAGRHLVIGLLILAIMLSVALLPVGEPIHPVLTLYGIVSTAIYAFAIFAIVRHRDWFDVVRDRRAEARAKEEQSP